MISICEVYIKVLRVLRRYSLWSQLLNMRLTMFTLAAVIGWTLAQSSDNAVPVTTHLLEILNIV